MINTCIEGKSDERTYMSLDVTGLPISKLENKKLKIREVDPSGATYSRDCISGTAVSINVVIHTSSHII